MLDGLDNASSEMEAAKVCLSLYYILIVASADMRRMKGCLGAI